jgi:chromate transport protein ChrA
MWILKGILVGTAIFVTGLLLYLAAFIWQNGSHYPKSGDRREEIGSDVFTLIRYFFLQSPLFYAALVTALLIGCSLVTL